MRGRKFLQDAAWFTVLTVAGVALILVDVNVGLPALLHLLAGRPL